MASDDTRFKETCIRELSIRSKWMEHHKKLFDHYLNAQQTKNHTEITIRESIIKSAMKATTLSNIARGYNNMKRAPPAPIPGIKNMRKTHTLVSTGLGDPQTDPRLARPDTDLTPDPIMRPVDANTMKLLSENRKEYLKKRTHINPDQKYYYPTTTSWDYGWRSHENQFFAAPEHGRCAVIKPDTVGPTPDPAYYTKPMSENNNFCEA